MDRDEAKYLITKEINRNGQNKINKIVLGTFLGIAIFALVMRITIGFLLDMGLVNGRFHIGFWQNPEESFSVEFEEWLAKGRGTKWSEFLDDPSNGPIARIIARHPNFLWFTTQFTWLTTIIIIVFLVFRFFKYDDSVPRWLRWVMTQRTLTLVTMYDMVVGIIFWASSTSGFLDYFSNTLIVPEVMLTILVHAVIPLCILSYSVIFLIKDPKASALKELFALKGLIFPIIYGFYYTIISIVWFDPYPVTNYHVKLTSTKEGDWAAWAQELWKIFAGLLVIYILLGLMTLLHNVILIKFNKNYDAANDYEIMKRKQYKIEGFKRRAIRREMKKWRDSN